MPIAARSRRKPPARNRPIALHVLVYPQSGRMLAHVLETDSISEGETPATALRAVEEALRLELAFDARDRRTVGPFEAPAPTAFWSALKSARLTTASRLDLPKIGATTLLAYRVDEAPGA